MKQMHARNTTVCHAIGGHTIRMVCHAARRTGIGSLL